MHINEDFILEVTVFLIKLLSSGATALNSGNGQSTGYHLLQEEAYLSEDVTVSSASSNFRCGVQCQINTRCAGFSYHDETSSCEQYTASCSLLSYWNESILASDSRHRHSSNQDTGASFTCNQSSYQEENAFGEHSCLPPASIITKAELSPWVEIIISHTICEVTFKMDSPSSMVIRLDTPDTKAYQYPLGLNIGNEQQLLFSVQACSDATISLQPDPLSITSVAYEIIIGGWGDSANVIRKVHGGAQLVRITHTGVVSCDEARPFWISWNDGIIRVGTGHMIDEASLLMEYVDTDPQTVSAAAFTTGWGSSGSWTIHSAVIPTVSVLSADETGQDCTLESNSNSEFSYSCGHAGTKIRISTDFSQPEALKLSELELIGWEI